MDERERRIAQNEAIFREVNEGIERAHERWAGVEAAPLEIVCECGYADCTQRIRLAVEQYEAVRAHPARFIVVAGHELPDVEQVVGSVDDANVVEKTGESAPFVAERDPRRR